MARLFWFRRDLRLQDNIALNAAIMGAQSDGDSIVEAAYALEYESFMTLSAIRANSLIESLKALDNSMGANLKILQGDPAKVLTSAAAKLGSKFVHATRAFDPTGVAQQNQVGLALKAAGIHLQLDDSYYAVSPGSVSKPDGNPYRVYTPFFKNWILAGWPRPVALGENFRWGNSLKSMGLPKPSGPAPFAITAGEHFASKTLSRFISKSIDTYDDNRNRADLSGTSHLSHALAHGEIHPRTILRVIQGEKNNSPGRDVFQKEIAWREFYADVLWHNPTTTTEYYEPRYRNMRYDKGKIAKNRLENWKQGKTGFPMVDAGMRQLLETGWMHNRVRMIVASFLVKDLHLEWQQGADWFEKLLSDFDPASNAHGWQWTAGCGTDASPYFRVFNPILQGYKFDPNGDYVRKFIPELRHVEGPAVHEPWLLIDGQQHGYPTRVVDHAVERDESLARLAEIKLPK